jgi:hypothetical protein
MKQPLLLLLITLFLASCSNEKKRVPPTILQPLSLTPQGEHIIHRQLSDYPYIEMIDDPEFLITGMIKSNCVYGNAIGATGKYTSEYVYFERLCEILTPEQKFELICHSDANVKLYAYTALQMINSEHEEKAKQILATDTAAVCTFSGCIQMNYRVKDAVIGFQ